MPLAMPTRLRKLPPLLAPLALLVLLPVSLLGDGACAPPPAAGRPAAPGHTAAAETVYTHAVVWTGVPGALPAEALAVGGGRLLAVGTAAAVDRYRGPETRTVDLGGRFVVPGLIDAHAHLMAGGFQLAGIGPRGAPPTSPTPPSDDERDRALARATEHAVSRGVTEVQDMGTWDDLATYRRAEERGQLGLRVYAFVPIATWERLADLVRQSGRGGEMLRWGGVEGLVDGSLGASTAWFYAPYADQPRNRGLTVTDLSDLAEQIRAADAAGLQVAVDAVGDRANDWLLDRFAAVARAGGRRDRRFRVEQAEHLTRVAIARLGRGEAIASMEPYRAIDDGRWAERRLGAARATTSYAWRSLLDSGARVAFGSDWTAAPIDPLLGIYAAVTRATLDGKHPGGWVPAEQIAVEQALRAYTLGSAYAGFQERLLGTLEPGKLADFVVLSDDLFAIPPAKIREVRVLRTVIGGRERYVAPARPNAR